MKPIDPTAPEVTPTIEEPQSQIPVEPPEQPSEPQPVYRPDDDPPQHDAAALAEIGIHKYESTHLVLYTDIAPELAEPLPALMDQAYAAWSDYFGPLPPNRAGTEFQMTGYIMADKRLFLETGLLPKELPEIPHGRNIGTVFWMNDQEHDYYRRHLMIHEGTHCFMQVMPKVFPPAWYMEGMAEYFGTHQTDAASKAEFGIMPQRSLDVREWGRLQIIAQERDAGRAKSLNEIFGLTYDDFFETDAYAWSWALCHFLANHPRYRERFRGLGADLEGTEFVEQFRESFLDDQTDMNREWTLFAAGVDYGFDFERAAVTFVPAKSLEAGGESDVAVAANRGWQSTGLRLEAGQAYQIEAEGMIQLAVSPPGWDADPGGITIRYNAGRPLGQLVGVILPDDAEKLAPDAVFSIERTRRLDADTSGTLFVRVNDAWGELGDNSGEFHLRITRVPSQ